MTETSGAWSIDLSVEERQLLLLFMEKTSVSGLKTVRMVAALAQKLEVPPPPRAAQPPPLSLIATQAEVQVDNEEPIETIETEPDEADVARPGDG